MKFVSYIHLLLIVLICSQSFTAGESLAADSNGAINIDYEFAINLMSTGKNLAEYDIENLKLFSDYRLYTTSVTVEGNSWNRLRLGFFETKQEAIDAMQQVVDSYPGAWVTIASEEERLNSFKTALTLNGPVKKDTRKPDAEGMATIPVIASEVELPPSRSITPEPEPVVPAVIATGIIAQTPEPVPAVEEAEVSTTAESSDEPLIGTARLLAEAQKAITAGDYDKAIQMTTAILEMPTSAESQEALELLGLARERKGQLAHARAEYEKYLQRYPEGEDAIRVNQRLAGLITATSKPTQMVSKDKANDEGKKSSTKWRTFGSLSQFYYRDERSIDDENNRVELSQLVTTFNLTSRGRSTRFDHRVQVLGDYSNDFIDDENEGRFSRFYYEGIDKKKNNRIKIGRQNYSKGGVLGRFDGAVLGLGITRKSAINVAAGYLLDVDNFLDFEYKKDRKFVSLALDVGNEFRDWDISLYGIQQMVGNIVDRQAIGGEVRYFKPTHNVFSVIDYDTSYNELNIFLLNANWIRPNQGTLYSTIDIRKVPYLSTSNALQGQTFLTIEEMLQTFSEEEVRQLARDRTATSNTLTVGGSKQLHGFLRGYGQYQISGDFNVNTISGMPASGGVPEIPASGTNYFVGGQLIGNGIIKRGDTSILTLRYGSTSTARDISFGLESRYPVTPQFRVNPRFRYLHRTGLENDSRLNTVRLSGKADYTYRSMHFEGELGVDFTNDTFADITTRSRGIFTYIGYRWDF